MAAWEASVKITALMLAALGATAGTALAESCASLASLALPQAKISMAEVVAAGAFTPPSGRPDPYRNLPEFCRVAATLTPSSDSDIRVEFWLPTAGWNRKLQVVGNGGWAGTISYSALAEAVRAGYAAASTDTGHSTPGGDFVLGHPEKLIDFSWRSEHEMTVKAKAVVEAFYGAAPRRSYWNGCSTGRPAGAQGSADVSRRFRRHHRRRAGQSGSHGAGVVGRAGAAEGPRVIHPAGEVSADPLCRAGGVRCLDGLKDGLISDPTRCKFDPGVLLCKGADGPGCLTAPQVEAARKVYGPARNPRTGKELFQAFAPGSELGWAVMGGGPEPYAPILDQVRYVVFQNAGWDWRTFDFDKDNERFERPEYLIMNATDPHLEKFLAHGGKLLLYHGWADQNVSPYMTVQYFDRVRQTLGAARTDGSVRLFMEPGMAHCGGGEGPNTFDKVSALDRWVEEGQAPASIIASHSTAGQVDRTRPLCPYPQVAQYKGSGSIDDAANFACKLP